MSDRSARARLVQSYLLVWRRRIELSAVNGKRECIVIIIVRLLNEIESIEENRCLRIIDE